MARRGRGGVARSEREPHIYVYNMLEQWGILIEIERKFCAQVERKFNNFSLFFFLFCVYFPAHAYGFFFLATWLLFRIASCLCCCCLASFSICRLYLCLPLCLYFVYTLALLCFPLLCFALLCFDLPVEWNNECHFGLDPRHSAPRQSGAVWLWILNGSWSTNGWRGDAPTKYNRIENTLQWKYTFFYISYKIFGKILKMPHCVWVLFLQSIFGINHVSINFIKFSYYFYH